MRFEILLVFVTLALIANIYTDGWLFKKLMSFRKYYQMAGIVLGAIFVYWLFKKNPNNMSKMLGTANEYIKYMPMDNQTAGFISPILDFTTKQNFFGDSQFLNQPYAHMVSMESNSPYERKILSSGGNGGENFTTTRTGENGGTRVKRSVSETKKKFVASRQNWKCGDCRQQLNAWFEVDHVVRLEHGGSNHVDNLLALCRECHGKKTTIENL